MATPFGSGELGKLVSQNRTIQLTWDDLLWAARALVGEGGQNISKMEAELTLWTWASRMFLPGFAFMRQYKQMVQAHSQPVNPKWKRDGEKCRVGGPFHDKPDCDERKLQRREYITNLQWDDIHGDLQDLVVQWARGQRTNPIPKTIDFAAKRIGPPGNAAQITWESKPEDPRHNQAFYNNRTSRAWFDHYVKIDFNGISSTESSSAPIIAPGYGVGVPDGPAPLENRIYERNLAITKGRTEPPADALLDYTAIYDGEDRADPHTESVLSGAASKYGQPFQQFSIQYDKTKSLAGSIEASQLLPIIEIKAPDLYEDSERLVNLTELIFGQSTVHNYFNDLTSSVDFRDRPLASVESLKISIQTPDVGGAASIMIGDLSLKIHNPDLIRDNHPKGKFLSFMLRQGYPLVIRFGWTGPPDIIQNYGLEWVERDFFISNHNISINIDKTMNLSLKILPAAQKILNQMFIGESLPVQTFDTFEQTKLIQEVLAETTTEKERRAVTEGLAETFRHINEPLKSTLREIEINRTDDGQVTFGTALHGALHRSLMVAAGQNAIGVPNYIEGLKRIQSQFLSRKFAEIIQQYSYTYTNNAKGISLNVVNVGPLIHKLVLPEVESMIDRLTETSPQVGTFNYSNINSNSKREKVRVVYDTFNKHAGQWADKPISTFPIGIDMIFADFRRERTVGNFAGTINEFIKNISVYISQEENFVVSQDDAENNRLETPHIRYELFEDPHDEEYWVVYFYDSKKLEVIISEALGELNRADPERGIFIEYDEAKSIISSKGIPWIEMGQENSLITSMNAANTGDDLIQSRNMILANSNFGERDIVRLPAGISREFMAGRQNLSDLIGVHTLIIPLKVDFTHYFLSKAVLFSPMYIYFPVSEFSGVFLPYQITHEISKGKATTSFSCFIQTTKANRIPRR